MDLRISKSRQCTLWPNVWKHCIILRSYTLRTVTLPSRDLKKTNLQFTNCHIWTSFRPEEWFGFLPCWMMCRFLKKAIFLKSRNWPQFPRTRTFPLSYCKAEHRREISSLVHYQRQKTTREHQNATSDGTKYALDRLWANPLTTFVCDATQICSKKISARGSIRLYGKQKAVFALEGFVIWSGRALWLSVAARRLA